MTEETNIPACERPSPYTLLCAAAPDLLAAAQWLVAQLAALHGPTYWDGIPEHADALAAIARATGKAVGK